MPNSGKPELGCDPAAAGTIRKIADGDAWQMPATIDDPAISDEIGSALEEKRPGS